MIYLLLGLATPFIALFVVWAIDGRKADRIDTAALDRAIRRSRLLLALCRKHGIREDDVRVMIPLIVARYRAERGCQP